MNFDRDPYSNRSRFVFNHRGTSKSASSSSNRDHSNYGLTDPYEHHPNHHSQRVKQVWAIGGGKGGVGKSMVASSLSIALSRMGNKVTAVDLDLGGANLHTAFGIELPRQTLGDFFSNRVQNLNEIVSPTGLPNLQVISGAHDSVRAANLTSTHKSRLLESLRSIDTDYVILDLGAGTSSYTIDFFLNADIGIITLLPEPTSIENSYRFIKTVYYRQLHMCNSLAPIRSLIEMAMDSKNPMGIKTPSDLYQEVNRANPELAIRLKEQIENFQIKLVINQARTQADVDIGFSIKSVCKKYFGIEMDYVGYLDYDSAVWQAIRKKRPIMLEFPNSHLVSNIERITTHLIRHDGHIRNQSPY